MNHMTRHRMTAIKAARELKSVRSDEKQGTERAGEITPRKRSNKRTNKHLPPHENASRPCPLNGAAGAQTDSPPQETNKRTNKQTNNANGNNKKGRGGWRTSRTARPCHNSDGNGLPPLGRWITLHTAVPSVISQG